MRQALIKKAAVYLTAGLSCGVTVMGAYPLVPAVFAALYITDLSGILLTGVMYAGMLMFMPALAGVKYGITIIVTLGVIRLFTWANESCPAFIAGFFASCSVILISIGGNLLGLRERQNIVLIIAEGIFTAGAVIFINRLAEKILANDELSVIDPAPVQNSAPRLKAYAETFQGLSHALGNFAVAEGNYTTEQLGLMQSEVTGRVCASCDSCAVCWEKETSPLYTALAQVFASIWSGTIPGEAEEKRLGEYCTKSRDMLGEAMRIFERISLNRAWYTRLVENRRIIAEQLDAMAYIMEDCAKEEKNLDVQEKARLSEIRYAARQNGIAVNELHLTETADGRLRVDAALSSRTGGCIALKSFKKPASKILEVRLREAHEARSFIGEEPVHFVFYEDTKFRAIQGISRIKKDGAQISGDNFSYVESERGELLMGLSDGMGSGSRACRESEMVLDLIEHFVEAGFAVETAIRLMNSAMVIKGENDQYSTVDVCKVNLYDGVMESYKIGAAATFIKHDGTVRVISEASLPIGAELDAEPKRSEDRLQNGDFIVMVTDGVLEYLHVMNPEETMREMIESIETNNPGIMSKRIMERVMLFTGGRAKDDMTVLCACLWEKK